MVIFDWLSFLQRFLVFFWGFWFRKNQKVMIDPHHKRVTTHRCRLTPRVPRGRRLFPIIWTRLFILLYSHWSTRGCTQGVYQSETFMLRVHLIVWTRHWKIDSDWLTHGLDQSDSYLPCYGYVIVDLNNVKWKIGYTFIMGWDRSLMTRMYPDYTLM